MTCKKAAPGFQVINGGGARRALIDRIALPEVPQMSAAELAADMAEIFALGIVQDLRANALTDPHRVVRIDSTTRFTMHELLCELRNLSWFDSRVANPVSVPAVSSPAGSGDAGHRRATRRNGDGQLTLQCLLRGGVALRGGGPVMSAFWESDHAVRPPVDPAEEAPGEDAPMSAWLGWCARRSQAGLRLPGGDAPASRRGSLGDRTDALHATPAARPFHNAALVALARGTGFDEGLSPADRWTGARLFALMAEAEVLARRFARIGTGLPNRLPRPAVTAARMTVWLAQEERQQGSHGALYRDAADELAASAPGLLHWVTRANQAQRGPQRFEHSLFLPLTRQERQHLNPSDLAAHVVVAGALSTLIKAVFDTSRRAQLQMVGQDGPALALEDQIDRLAANVALMRCVSGGYFPAENHQDLRLGQAIALQCLRQRLTEDNRSAALSLRDFDGRSLQILAHPRHFGRGHAELRCDGTAIAWPCEVSNPAAHLTQVV
ncbi:bromoperoxidase [Antarctobacter jejuensis]|uniref:bromoperoxidase n=1 Tax=Antarctobacter jejuensis TaxID=1439938 RepID=UPI003FD27A2B